MFLDQAKWYLKQCQLATKKVHVMVGHNTHCNFCVVLWIGCNLQLKLNLIPKIFKLITINNKAEMKFILPKFVGYSFVLRDHLQSVIPWSMVP